MPQEVEPIRVRRVKGPGIVPHVVACIDDAEVRCYTSGRFKAWATSVAALARLYSLYEVAANEMVAYARELDALDPYAPI